MSITQYTIYNVVLHSIMFTLLHPPKMVDNFIAPDWIKSLLNSNKPLPHLLLYGPPGTGKTTFSKLITKNKNALFLNASDERGIGIIRSKVKKYASYAKDKYIILDECENLTKDSQTCLRRVLEDFDKTTFIFITNYYSRIIDPLKSRLLKVKFSRGLLRNKVIADYKLTDDISVYLYDRTDGDIRRGKMIEKVIIGENVEKQRELIDFYTCKIINGDVDFNVKNNTPILDYLKYMHKVNKDGSTAVEIGYLERMAIEGVSDEIIYEKIRNINKT